MIEESQPQKQSEKQSEALQTPPQHALQMTPQTKRAVISTAVIIVLLVAIIGGFAAMANRLSAPRAAAGVGGSSNAPSASSGDQGVLLGGTPAPAFTLTDQNGATVTLESLKGKPTIFTFFDSLCPHTDCSLMAQYINFTAQDLGAQTDQVNWVALSLNPWHDTTQSVNAFISNQQLKPHLTYLMGSPTQLQPLWDAFHMQSVEQPDGVVIHTTGVYLLDSQARELVYMDEGFDPHVLSSDVHLVLTKGDSAFAGQQSAQTSNAVTQIHSVNGMQVTLTASPGQYGTYDFTVLLQSANGEAIPNAQVGLDLSMSAMAMQPLHVDLQPLAPASTGAYRASGVLSMKGQWTVNATITPQGASQPSVTTFSFNANY